MNAPLVGIVVLAGYTLLWGSIAALVYRDAVESNRSRLAALGWAVAVFVLEVFGLIAYKATDWVELD